jgi:flagellin
MSLVVNTNTQSLFAQRALNFNTTNLKRNIENLSTGYRINKAADDAAGLSISNKLTTTIRGLDKAKQNSSDGISLIQTAEGGLQIIQENLQRIRELVVQGTNGTNGPSEADALQREINERVNAIQSISKSVKFNGIDLLYSNTASSADVTLQTGANNAETTSLIFRTGITANTGIEVDATYERTGTTSDYGTLVEGISTANFGLHRIHLGTTGMTVDSVDKTLDTVSGVNTSVNLDHMDTMISNVSRMRSYLGAMQNALESKVEYIDIAIQNASESRSRILDTDVAKESSVLVKNQILQQSAAAMLSQANSQPQIALNLIGG